MTHQVVVVGSGFGGLFAVKALATADVEVTLIDKSSHHLFQPLLYQVASSQLPAEDVARPLSVIFDDLPSVTVLPSARTR